MLAWQTRHALRVLDEELHAAKEAFAEIKHELQAQVQSGFHSPLRPAGPRQGRPLAPSSVAYANLSNAELSGAARGSRELRVAHVHLVVAIPTEPYRNALKK